MESFFRDNFSFQANGLEHLLSVAVFTILFFLILFANHKHKSFDKQKRFIIIFSLVIFGCQIAKTFIRIGLGNFDHTHDLPLHLCNIMPLLLPLALYLEKRVYWAICFMWIMAGTFQSLITPTLEHSLPHYEYFRYWIVHVGLVLGVFYPIIYWGYRLKVQDIFWGWLTINGLAFIIYHINNLLGSNYMYMQGKPGEGTIYDLLGPWPWYILSLEFVAILLFTILFVPFYIFEKISTKT